jgi:hypothetical protein
MSEEEPVTPAAAPQSFIIKFWLEETTEGERRMVWRGHITHVPSSERRYVRSLDDILDFISPHLEAMGAEVERRRMFWVWLKRWMSGR